MISPEWSHKIQIEKIESRPMTVQLTATEGECRDLARRFRVLGLEDLRATLSLRRESASHIIYIKGEFSALITQACVVTLEPVKERIEGALESWFSAEEDVVSLARVRREKASLRADAELPIPEEKDDPEPVVDGLIDIGELVAQSLSLEINPYPRKDGLPPEEGEDPTYTAAGKVKNPFAALKDWKFGKETEK